MTIPSTILASDRDRQFLDWGTEITLRQVTPTLDPQTQQVTEAITDTTITAIVGNAPSNPTPGTAAQHQTDDLHVYIKSEQAPNITSTTRIVYDSKEYDIATHHHSPRTQITTLTCRKTTN